MNAVSNLTSPLAAALVQAGLSTGAALAPKPETAAPVATSPVPPAPTATKPAKPAKPETAAEKAYKPTKRHLDAMGPVVAEVTRTLKGEGSIYYVMAAFGELAGLAGNRERTRLALAAIHADPDKYFPADCAVDARNALLKRFDKGKNEQDHSRAVTAITAGSVLMYYLDSAYDRMRSVEGGVTSTTRLAIALGSECAKARAGMDKPVDKTWNGCGIDLQAEIDKAMGKETAARATASAGRTVAKQAAATSTAPAPTAPATSTAPAPTAPAPTAPAPASAAGVAAAVAASGSVSAPDWAKAIAQVEGILAGLASKAPDAARKSVEGELATIKTALANIRHACDAADKAAKASNPAADVK